MLARSRGCKITKESWEDDEQEIELLTLIPINSNEVKTLLCHFHDLVKHWGFTTDTNYLQCLNNLQEEILNPKARAEWIEENQMTHPKTKENK